MIETGVSNDTIISYDPALADYYPKTKSSFSDQIDEAMRMIVSKLMQNRKDVKKYCTPLVLTEEVTISTNTETTPVYDEIRRMIWKLRVSTYAGVLSFTLKGCDTETGTYETIGALTFTSATTKYLVFNTPYKYYKIVPSVTSTIKYNSDLIEASFYHAHLYLSLMLAYKTAVKQEGDRFDYKSKNMEEMFNNEWNTMLATYDDDESGTIDNQNELYGEPENKMWLR